MIQNQEIKKPSGRTPQPLSLIHLLGGYLQSFILKSMLFRYSYSGVFNKY